MESIGGRGITAAAATLTFALIGGTGGTVMAQDEPGIEVPAGLSVSGSVGTEVSTHFVSYGTDVWGAGGDWSRPSVFAFSEVSLDFDAFDVTTGVWFDLNDRVDSPIGGPVQEVDWYVGVGFDIDRFRVDVVYQAWFYGSQTEEIFDVSLGFDDTGLIFEDFAFNPTLVAHTRLAGGTGTEGTALVFGIEPAFTFMEESDYPLTVSIPAEVAFGVNDFYATNGYGYTAVGATASTPLAFIPQEFGQWSAAANLTYYWTDDEAIGNPRSDFLTGLVGVYLNF
ncbi:MAG: hypothetical protein WD534_09620 [Phycisphaeraceae bacterium]